MLNTDGVAGNQAQPTSLVGFMNMEIDMENFMKVALVVVFFMPVVYGLFKYWI